MRSLELMIPIALLVLAGCESDPTGNERDDRPGAVLVTVSDHGGDDPDGYGVIVDGIERERIVGSGFVTIGELTAGGHTVELADIDGDCRVVPALSRTVTVRAGLTETIEFVVDCRPAEFDRIVFESDRTGNWEIFTMNADGTDPRQFTNDGELDLWPEYSPGGTQIVWSAYRDGNGEIYVANVDGTEVRNLTNHPARDYLPSWSPDGETVAFCSDRDGSVDIWTIEVETGVLTQITDVSAADLEPDWTADGTQLVFSSFRSGDGQHVFIQPLTEADATQLTFGNLFLEEEPDVSPDGMSIAFRKGNVAPEGIFVMDVDGGNKTELTDGDNAASSATWSSDGLRLAYESLGDIYVVARDGTGSTNITNSDWSDTRPHWGPAN